MSEPITLSFLALAAGAGALSLLTPCVLPMVPVTVSYFTARGASSRSDTVRAAAVFAGGIIATFTVVGLAVSALVGAAGLARFASNPWVNIAIGLFFVGFALNLFGWLSVAPPARLVAALDRATRRPGGGSARPALIAGVLFTITSLTCTTPLLGTLLVAASRGQWTAPAVGMLVYSAAFAAPFFLLALLPALMRVVPRGGEWMNSLKVALGLLELAAAVKFFSNAALVWRLPQVTRTAVLAVWVALAVIGAVYFLIPRRSSLGSGMYLVRRGGASAGASAAFALSAAWLGWGASGKPLGLLEAFLPPAPAVSPRGAPATGSRRGELAWRLNDQPGALAEARAAQRLVFVDFTGYTCTNCRWMEANVFARPEVAAELAQFTLSRLYTDGDAPLYERQQSYQQDAFGTVALPFYAVLDAAGRTVATSAGVTRDPAEFIHFLRSARLAKRVAREPRAAVTALHRPEAD